jgi:hypothetical protein
MDSTGIHPCDRQGGVNSAVKEMRRPPAAKGDCVVQVPVGTLL